MVGFKGLDMMMMSLLEVDFSLLINPTGSVVSEVSSFASAGLTVSCGSCEST
jgi:hypothetical protein